MTLFYIVFVTLINIVFKIHVVIVYMHLKKKLD